MEYLALVDIYHVWLQSIYPKATIIIVTGDTSGKASFFLSYQIAVERSQLFQTAEASHTIALLSVKANAVASSLLWARFIIFPDPDWQAVIIKQASARSIRVTQPDSVSVFRLRYSGFQDTVFRVFQAKRFVS